MTTAILRQPFLMPSIMAPANMLCAVNMSKEIQNHSISGASNESFDRELDYITVLLFVKPLRRDGVLNAGCQSRGNVPSICSTLRASRNHGTTNCLAEIYACAPESSIGNAM